MTRVRSASVGAASRTLATAAAVTVGNTSLLACPVCFGGAEGSLIDGAKLGVLALVAVTLVVQGSFVAFFIYLRRRAKRMADADLEVEWLELQRGSRPS
jgi:hypothetical protein